MSLWISLCHIKWHQKATTFIQLYVTLNKSVSYKVTQKPQHMSLWISLCHIKWHKKATTYVTMNKSVSYKVAQKSHNHRACWPKWYLVSIMTFNSGFESLHKQLPGKKKEKKKATTHTSCGWWGCPITTLQRSQFTTWTSFDFFYITLCGTKKIYVTIYSGRFKGQW